jgi:hypothetical protein
MKPSEVITHLEICWKAGVNVLLSGPPGCGKSSLVRQLAEGVGAGFHAEAAPGNDPVDWKGLPNLKEDYTAWSMGALVKKAWDLFHDFGKPPVICIDEIGNVLGAAQTALNDLILCNSLGGHKLPEGTLIVLTTNRGMDRAYTSTLASTLPNRLWWTDVEVDVGDFCSHAVRNNFHPSVIAWIRFKGQSYDRDGRALGALFEFNPARYGDGNYAYATSRSWETVSKLIKANDGKFSLSLVGGAVGAAMAADFVDFAKSFDHIPTRREVVEGGEKAKVPGRDMPGALYAVSSALVGWAEKENITAIMRYVERLPRPFQALVVQDLSEKAEWFAEHKVFVNFVVKNQGILGVDG